MNETRKLPVKLSDDEMLELGQQIAQLEIETDELESEKKKANDVYNGQIKEKQAKVMSLSVQLKSGEKIAEVDCYWSTDYPRQGLKTLIRYDSGEDVETVEMDEDDDQYGIPFNESGDNGDAIPGQENEEAEE